MCTRVICVRELYVYESYMCTRVICVRELYVYESYMCTRVICVRELSTPCSSVVIVFVYIVLVFHIFRTTQDKISMPQPPHTHRNLQPITPHHKLYFCLIHHHRQTRHHHTHHTHPRVHTHIHMSHIHVCLPHFFLHQNILPHTFTIAVHKLIPLQIKQMPLRK